MVRRGDTYKTHFSTNTLRLINSLSIKKACEAENVEVTILLNCLLGTIVAVAENKSIRNRLSNKLSDENLLIKIIPDKIGFISNKHCEQLPKIDKEFYYEPEFLNDILFMHETPAEIVSRKNSLSNLSEYDFLSKIRNGIAHQNIDFILSEEVDHDDRQKWIGIRLWNIRPERSKKSELVREPDVKNFEVEFTIEEIIELAKYVSTYLE